MSQRPARARFTGQHRRPPWAMIKLHMMRRAERGCQWAFVFGLAFFSSAAPPPHASAAAPRPWQRAALRVGSVRLGGTWRPTAPCAVGLCTSTGSGRRSHALEASACALLGITTASAQPGTPAQATDAARSGHRSARSRSRSPRASCGSSSRRASLKRPRRPARVAPGALLAKAALRGHRLAIVSPRHGHMAAA